MSLLSDFENRIASAVEGLFASAFRSPAQPAEIAKALGKQMDKGRTVGVSKVYAPNLYTVVLSPEDDEQFGSFLETLAAELATYLIAYAGEQHYEIPARPIVRFVVDPELRLGRFEVYSELVSADELYEPAEEVQARFVAAPAPDTSRTQMFATITITGLAHDVVLKGDRMLIGRLAESDIFLDDANVSRTHAALVSEGAGWVIEDLNSTNGTFINGQRVDRARLRDGDVIQVGANALVFHEPRR